MSFATCIVFCQMLFTPIVFAVLYCGWKNIVPQWYGLAHSVAEFARDFYEITPYQDSSDQLLGLLLFSFVIALAASLPLSLMFGSRGT